LQAVILEFCCFVGREEKMNQL